MNFGRVNRTAAFEAVNRGPIPSPAEKKVAAFCAADLIATGLGLEPRYDWRR